MSSNQAATSIPLSETFQRLSAPKTDRTVVQLTSGPGFCYPLYYFIPSITTDGRYLVYHRSEAGTVQLYRLDLGTGESTQLTCATGTETRWYPWCSPAGAGVLDHRSALCDSSGDVIYFDGNVARLVNVYTLADRELFRLPDDRLATGQNCFSPDGKWFFYIDHDRKLHEEVYGQIDHTANTRGPQLRHLSVQTRLAGFHLDTGEHRELILLNSPFHHVHPYGDSHLVFSSLTTERSILLTDYHGGWYTHLRTQTRQSGMTGHYCASQRGILYEAIKSADSFFAGIVSPETRQFIEFPLPKDTAPGLHIAADPAGTRILIERNSVEDAHELLFLAKHRKDGVGDWRQVLGDWRPFGGSSQKSHFHPRIVLDGKWVLITAGDPASQSNHLFLVDISDLPETEGIELP